MTESPDEYCAAEVRRQDPDRWLTALFAPDVRRPALLALYAFNSEIARAREAVSQPMIGQIRLQWWREAWDGIAAGKPRQHPVVLALHAHCRQADPADVAALIDARERDMEPAPMADMAALLDYAEQTSAPLMRLAAAALGAEVKDAGLSAALAAAGTAYALTGLLRAAPHLARQGRVYLPVSLLRDAGIVPEAVYQGGDAAAVRSVTRQVAEAAGAQCAAGRSIRWPATMMPAVLPAALAGGYLKALVRAGYEPAAMTDGRFGVLQKQMTLLLSAWRRRL